MNRRRIAISREGSQELELCPRLRQDMSYETGLFTANERPQKCVLKLRTPADGNLCFALPYAARSWRLRGAF